MDNKKLIDAVKVERLVQYLNNKTKAEETRALAAEEMLENITQEIKNMFGGKSIRYITQEEYDNLTDEQKYDPTVSYFIIDADYIEHEHENKEFLDGLSQEVLDDKVDKEDLNEVINELSSKLIEKEASDYVNVKDLGIIGDGITDVTAALQNILDANDNVFIPEGVYLINGPAINDAPSDNPDSGLVLHSNQKLLMSDKAILKLIPCSTKNSCVLRIESHCENVVIEGGNIEGDRYEHLGTTGEAGMGIYLSGNTNVVIKNVNISKCWGDGVIINNSKGIDGTELEPSKDIYMYNVVCDDNRRQGMTIVGVDGAVIENCKFINTNGINPQAGVDIEPSPYETNYAKNIEFINCEFSGNARTGIITAINENNGNPTIIENVKLNNCTSVNNKEHGILVTGGVSNFEINDCYVARNEYDGIHVGAAINCIISNTVSEYNTQQGIYLYNTNECNVVNSHANYNGESGIKLNMASNEIKIFNNTTIGNTTNNIHVVNSQNCIISHNISLYSGNNGIYIQDSSEIMTDSNFVKDSMVVGLYLQNANRSKIYNNNVIGSSVKTDQNVPNIICVGEYNTIVENTCRIGSNTNRPSGGLAIGWYGSSATNNYVFNNDCYNSGTNFGLRDMGTNTIMSTNIDLNGELINIHQTKDDETLNTADKTIVGAINELQILSEELDTDIFNATAKTIELDIKKLDKEEFDAALGNLNLEDMSNDIFDLQAKAIELENYKADKEYVDNLLSTVDATTLNGYSIWAGTTEELEQIVERDPNTLYFEVGNDNDDQEVETVQNISPVDNVLTLTTNKYQKTVITNETEIVFPQVTELTELHLYFDKNDSDEMNLILPDNCKWRVDPNIEDASAYELIAVYNTSYWLVNIISYSDDNTLSL